MKKKATTFLIILGIVIRLILAVTTYHPDLSVFAFAGKLIVLDGHWLNFYNYGVQYLNGVATLFPHGMILNYQPLAYLIPSLFYLPFFPVLKDTAGLIIDGTWHSQSPFYLPLLVYKLPLLIADISLIFLIPKLFASQTNKKLSSILWALNPIAIYVSSMIGQVDIIITFFITLSLVTLKRNRFYATTFFLAVSALIKPAAVILIPLISLYLFIKKQYLKSLISLTIGVGTYFLGILPFLSSPIYRHYALFANQIGKSIYASISVAAGHDIPWFFILYAIIIALLIYKKTNLTASLAAALLSSLAFTHFHPQWLLWLTPWLLYFAIKKNQFLPLLFSILSWFVIIFSFDKSLSTGLFFGLSLPALQVSTLFTSLARAWIIAHLFIILFIDGHQKEA